MQCFSSFPLANVAVGATCDVECLLWTGCNSAPGCSLAFEPIGDQTSSANMPWLTAGAACVWKLTRSSLHVADCIPDGCTTCLHAVGFFRSSRRRIDQRSALDSCYIRRASHLVYSRFSITGYRCIEI